MNKTASEQKVRLQISKNFPWCPFCCSEHLRIDVKPQREIDYISCSNCRARWELKIQDKIRSVKLITTSLDWKGKELLEKETEPKFWQNKAWICVLTRKTPKNPS
ncbi:MAG: hypothetical protein PVF96_07360 [Candidatus Bathyarchaeota archaeon]|jgi:transcription elongation factor Elf1